MAGLLCHCSSGVNQRLPNVQWFCLYIINGITMNLATNFKLTLIGRNLKNGRSIIRSATLWKATCPEYGLHVLKEIKCIINWFYDNNFHSARWEKIEKSENRFSQTCSSCLSWVNDVNYIVHAIYPTGDTMLFTQPTSLAALHAKLNVCLLYIS